MTGSLLDALATVIWPTPSQTQLLRAALWRGDDGARAWRAWLDDRADPPADLAAHPTGARLLAPLLHHNGRSGAPDTPPVLRTYLRTASLREEVRSAQVRTIMRDAVNRLVGAGIRTTVLKGMALSEGAYPSASLRHCHDIDLLIPPSSLEDAVQTLGFDPPTLEVGRVRHPLTKIRVHRSALPVAMHGTLTPIAHHARLTELAGARLVDDTSIAPGFQLSPADMLVHVCVHAATGPQRQSLLWASDAWYLLQRWPTMAWPDVLETVRGSNAAIPAYLTFRYLQEQLAVPVPILDTLRPMAHRADRRSLDVAVICATEGIPFGPSRFAALVPAGPERRRAVRALLFPTPALIAAVGRSHTRTGALAAAGGWPFRILTRRVARRVSRSAPQTGLPSSDENGARTLAHFERSRRVAIRERELRWVSRVLRAVHPRGGFGEARRIIQAAVVNPIRSRRRIPVVVMFHWGRSGSTVVADMLDQHPQIGWSGELYQRWMHRLHVHGTHAPPDHYRLARFARSRADRLGSGYFGYEIMPWQFRWIGVSLADYLSELEHAGAVSYVLLTRTNVLRRAVSAVAAYHRVEWHRPIDEERTLEPITFDPQRVELEYTIKPLLTHLETYARETEAVRAVLAGRRLLELNYEDDIEPDPNIAYRKVTGFLELPAAPVRVRLGRVNPYPLHRIVKNFEEIRAALADTPYAWMADG